jgi:GH18 family chitinase
MTVGDLPFPSMPLHLQGVPTRSLHVALCVFSFLCSLVSHGNSQPAFGLSSLPERKLVFGYINSLRGGETNQAVTDLGRINYEAADVVVHGFAEPRSDGSLSFPNGNFTRYRDAIIANAHARGRSVVLSIGGARSDTHRAAFADIAGDSSHRAKFANHILRALRVFGYDGVDIDYEFPANGAQRDEFSLLMKEIHHVLKQASSNYIVMFGCSTGFYLDQMDWRRLARYADFAFYFGYDWRNPANGPLTNPGVLQWLSGGTERIEASVRGAVDYILAHGFPSEKLIVGLPFYGSNGKSWFTVRETWAASASTYTTRIHPQWLEVEINNSWWTTPDALERKMSALLRADHSALANRSVVRGIGFWEFGHERVDQPDLSRTIARWIAAQGNIGSPKPADVPPADGSSSQAAVPIPPAGPPKL